MRRTVSASTRLMRCCLSSCSTVDLRRCAALAGVGALVQSSSNQFAVRSFGELQHLRVIPPELLMDTVAQPNPFLLQFLGKPRPRTQFD